ncbi:glutathione transferase GST 23-like isoform X3 [Asparagus officinalis]|uniref:glutathione transferase GST 23-like isoform X3 n=1 Tax=Asparagus officinalis TaxID=4686 RepID=UPI00098E0ADA|nr:glutathione transferase GST 23-like isoform X3 [Asparagus officinalis]
MVEDGLKLYGTKLSPFVLRVEWALEVKGIKYEYVTEDLKNKSPQLLEYNPVYKMVPVLVHHENPVCESIMILEYIEDVWKNHGSSILPSDPYERAEARFWAKFSEEKCLQGCFEVFSKTGEEQLKAVKELQERLKTLEEYLEGKKFFGGETIGLVDIVAGWIPSWIPIIEEIVGIKIVDEEELPLIYAWMHDILELDLVKKTMPPLDEVKTHMRNIREDVLRKTN